MDTERTFQLDNDDEDTHRSSNRFLMSARAFRRFDGSVKASLLTTALSNATSTVYLKKHAIDSIAVCCQ